MSVTEEMDVKENGQAEGRRHQVPKTEPSKPPDNRRLRFIGEIAISLM